MAESAVIARHSRVRSGRCPSRCSTRAPRWRRCTTSCRPIAEVVDDGRYILGPEVAAFEREFAAYCRRDARDRRRERDRCADDRAARDGRRTRRRGRRARRSRSTRAPRRSRRPARRPVFCDVDPETMCLTPETVRAALTPRTKAVIAVHLFGNVAPDPGDRGARRPVLEDAAQAAGPTPRDGRPGALGTLGDVQLLPLEEPRRLRRRRRDHDLDAQLAERVRMLRFHGSRDKVTYEHVGCNSRLDELQAAVLRVQLPHLDAWADGRRAAGPGTTRRPGSASWWRCRARARGREPAWHLYVIRHAQADAIAAALAARRPRPEGLLPHARPPPAGDGTLRRRRRAAGDRRGRPHAPRDPDQPRPEARAGGRGHGCDRCRPRCCGAGLSRIASS